MQTITEDKINQAFQSADYKLGLELLRKYSKLHPDDPEILHRLAVVEEQIGIPENAKNAHIKGIELSPKNYLAYLYAGYWFQKNNDHEHAVILYSYAFDINSNALLLWKNNQHPKETRIRSMQANTLLRRNFSDLHRKVVKNGNASKRIYESIWTRTHDQNYTFKIPGQKPQFFYIPSLNSKAFFESHEFNWARAIENSCHVIKSELVNALPEIQDTGRPYLDDNIEPGSNLTKLAGSLNWTAFDLYKNGKVNQKNHQNFPKTLELLNKLPLYGLEQNPYEVFFSLLKPQQHIKAHYGLSNHSLTVHLPLIVPENCKLRVGNEWRHWEEGKLIIFDDTFDHEAINESEKDRVVLIFSIWHPDLSIEERQDIRASFHARQDWLESRKSVKALTQGFLE